MSLLVYRVVAGCMSLSKKHKAKHANPPLTDTALSANSAAIPSSQPAGTPAGELQSAQQSHPHNTVPTRSPARRRSSSYWNWIEEPEPDFGCLIERVGPTPSNKHFLEQVSQPTRRVRYKIHKDGRRERDDTFPYESVFTPFQIRPGPKLPWSVKHHKLSGILPGREKKSPFLEREYLKHKASMH